MTQRSVLVLVFLVLGFVVGRGSPANVSAAGMFSGTGFMLAIVPVMFTYSGWNAAAYVAEEVRSPARNVPIALGLGTLVVIAIYVGLNILYLYALVTWFRSRGRQIPISKNA